MTDATSEGIAPTPAGARRLADFGGADRLSVAERKLLASCRIGEPCQVGDAAATGRWPDAVDEDNKVSAEFLRFLALGGDEDAPVHERGIQLQGACLVGKLNLYGVRATRAIELKWCRIEAINIQWATLQPMDLSGCLVESGFDGDGMRCEGCLFLREGTHICCEVKLPAADISGGLFCEGALFDNPSGVALNCVEAKIGLRLGLDPWVRMEDEREVSSQFVANGSILLMGATIGGHLECRESKISTKPESHALHCNGAKISGRVNLHRSVFQGQVSLANATIGDDLICRGAQFSSQSETETKDAGQRFAFDCFGARISGNVFLDDGLAAEGQMSLAGADIGGGLWCDDASFKSGAGYCLDCEGAKVGRTFAFRNIRALEGSVSLFNMRVDTLADDATGWQLAAGNLNLDGFAYERLADDQLVGLVEPAAVRRRSRRRLSIESRVTWLKLQRKDYWRTAFRPRPWEQLIKVFRAMGHPNRAREVGYQKEKALQQAGVTRNWKQRPLRSLFNAVYGIFTGFGYKTDRIFWFLSGTWLVFALGYFWAMEPCRSPACAPARLFVFAKPPAATTIPRAAAAKGGATARQTEPTFDAVLYSLDALLPIDLGYVSKWESAERPAGRALRWAVVVETILGWIFAGVVGAGALGTLVKRD